jgi:hypothetical protein
MTIHRDSLLSRQGEQVSAHRLENQEAPEVAAIRDALGAIAIGEPAVYRLYTGPQGDWCVRREGDVEERHLASREEALAFARLAVVRCASYCLYLQGSDRRITREFFNWSPRQPLRGA